MAGQITKRCHWVSQSYLRAFAADDARQKIWRFSKNQGEPELKPIRKVAVRHHLYAPMNWVWVNRTGAIRNGRCSKWGRTAHHPMAVTADESFAASMHTGYRRDWESTVYNAFSIQAINLLWRFQRDPRPCGDN